jgi:hypothetical protein
MAVAGNGNPERPILPPPETQKNVMVHRESRHGEIQDRAIPSGESLQNVNRDPNLRLIWAREKARRGDRTCRLPDPLM